jgi:methylmalonyl-CoA mutase C-terminal domain/subunit
MNQDKKIKVLITKLGLDGHDRGAKVVSTLLREAGMEVIYLGLYQTAESVVQAAMEEDVDVVGLSCLSGEHLTFAPEVVTHLNEKKIEDVLVIVGGVVPREDIPEMKSLGIDEVFTAGSLTVDIVKYIRDNVKGN